MSERVEGEIPRRDDIIADKYVVEEVLGQGAMGVVVAARHKLLGHRVAMKFLVGSPARRPDVVPRFIREARAVVELQSEHVVRVLDVGTLPDGGPYIVMERLVGEDLHHLVGRRGPLPIEEAVDYVLQACAAMSEAHGRGIVHRDLKPGNLFLTRRGDGSPCIKVLDFGISKVTLGVDADLNLTDTGSFLGSPLYMSPEQVRSTKRVDHRSDIWALGVVLQKLLTGNVPFSGDGLPAICAAVVADAPTPVRAQRPEIPVGLEAVILKCLQKDVADRPQSVAELAQSLAPFASADGRAKAQSIMASANGGASMIPEPRSFSASSETSVPNGLGTVTAQSIVAQQPTVAKSRGPLVVASIAAVVLVGGAGAIAIRNVMNDDGRAAQGEPKAAAKPSPTPSTTAQESAKPPEPPPQASATETPKPASPTESTSAAASASAKKQPKYAPPKAVTSASSNPWGSLIDGRK